MIGAVLTRDRLQQRRRLTLTTLVVAGVVALIGILLTLQGDNLYDDATRLAAGDVPREHRMVPYGGTRMARAAILSLHMPGAEDLLAWNGDSHE